MGEKDIVDALNAASMYEVARSGVIYWAAVRGILLLYRILCLSAHMAVGAGDETGGADESD